LSNLAIGTNNGMRYGTQEAAPAFISPGSDVAMQYALQSERIRAAIYTAAKMEPPGAKADGGDAASGIARAYDFSQTDAGLQTFARQLERFEYECVALAVAWDTLGDAGKIAAASAATKIAYPQRFDAAGIRDDLSAMFAVLDDKVRPQMPPAVVREARLGIARGLLPEATADVESEYTAEAAAMYERDAATLAAAPATDAEAAVNAAMDALPAATPGELTTATPSGRYAIGDRVRVKGTPHMPGQTAGAVAEVKGGAYGIRFDAMPDTVHRWYVADELAPDGPPSAARM